MNVGGSKEFAHNKKNDKKNGTGKEQATFLHGKKAMFGEINHG